MTGVALAAADLSGLFGLAWEVGLLQPIASPPVVTLSKKGTPVAGAE